MKEIKAFTRPEEFDNIFSALRDAGFCCITVTECEGTGQYMDPDTEEYPSLKLPYMHSKMFKLEIVCHDSDVDNIVNIIEKHAKTGKPGDGIIFVINVERAVHIRSGNESEEFLFGING